MNKGMKIVIIILGVMVIFLLGCFIYFKVTYISKDEVKDIIATNIKTNQENVYFEKIEIDFDKGLYEADIYYQNKEFEYKLDAKSGKVVYTDYYNNNSQASEQEKVPTNSNITLEEAKKIATDNANININDVRFIRSEQEMEHGILLYEVDFIYNDFDYEYKINATTGEIISFDKDSIYD